MKPYAKLIRQTRRNLGFSQAKLAHAAGLSLLSVQKIESGRANPSFSSLTALFEALGLNFKIELKPIDWNALVDCGAPLTTTNGESRKPRRPSKKLLLELLPRACMNLPAGREREALAALILAIEEHYPTFYRQELSDIPSVRAIRRDNSELSGRTIKLKRLALEKLANYL